MTNLAIGFIGYVNGVHTVKIIDDSDSPIHLLKDGYSTTSYKSKNESSEIKTFIQSIEREVKQLTKKKQKKFGKLVASIPLMLLPFLNMKEADAQMIQVDFPFFSDNKEESIIPIEIWDILKQLVSSGGEIAFYLGMILIAIAGILIMLGRKEKAVSWITDIVKGYGIVLLSPIIIILLTAIVYLLLGNINGLDLFY